MYANYELCTMNYELNYELNYDVFLVVVLSELRRGTSLTLLEDTVEV